MSFALLKKVWESNLDGVEKAVLLRLADYAHDDGTSIFPSIATVARAVSWSPDKVRRTIKRLRVIGVLIEVQSASCAEHRPTEYRIDLERLAQVPGEATPLANSQYPTGQQPVAPLPVASSPPGCEPVAPLANSQYPTGQQPAEPTKEPTNRTLERLELFPPASAKAAPKAPKVVFTLENYQPPEKTLAWIAVKAPGIDWDFELEKWRVGSANPRKGQSKPPVIKDFDASFRQWVLHAVQFQRERNVLPFQRPAEAKPKPKRLIAGTPEARAAYEC
jgi:hypothetical protein